MTVVSIQTLNRAERTVRALEAGGLTVKGVNFGERGDTFSVLLEGDDSVDGLGAGGGTIKREDTDEDDEEEIDPAGAGGGTIKADE